MYVASQQTREGMALSSAGHPHADVATAVIIMCTVPIDALGLMVPQFLNFSSKKRCKLLFLYFDTVRAIASQIFISFPRD